MRELDKLKLAQQTWETAKKSGADSAGIFISHNHQTEVSVRAGTIENLSRPRNSA
jgi:predicted Zn-dependent protease